MPVPTLFPVTLHEADPEQLAWVVKAEPPPDQEKLGEKPPLVEGPEQSPTLYPKQTL